MFGVMRDWPGLELIPQACQLAGTSTCTVNKHSTRAAGTLPFLSLTCSALWGRGCPVLLSLPPCSAAQWPCRPGHLGRDRNTFSVSRGGQGKECFSIDTLLCCPCKRQPLPGERLGLLLPNPQDFRVLCVLQSTTAEYAES